MAEAIGVASGIAQLVAVAVQITQLSYSYVSDVINAPRAQKTYLQEVSALTDVLFRLERALQDSEVSGAADARSSSLSSQVVSECHQRLALQRSRLEKQIHRLVWPFQDRELKKAIDDLHRFRGIFADYTVANISVTASATLRHVDALKLDQERSQLLEWLQKPESSSKMQPTALPRTGSWLHRHPQFQEWATESPSILWCYGPPGVGKSILASIAIDQLSRTRSSENACITHYFSDFIARKQQTEMAILQSILKQVVEYGSKETISVLLRRRNELRSTPKPVDLALAFAEVCHQQEKTYFVLDAPDELETTQIVSRLQSFVDAGCRVLVTSRDHPDLREAFSNARQIEVHASSEDLTAYVQHRFGESDFRDTVGNTHTIVDAVVKKANGLFLLAKLSMDHLLGLPTIKKMRLSLETLPTQLNEAFQSSVERIDAQPEALRETAHRLIGWIIHADRPLQPAEVVHAFAIEPEDEEIDEESFTGIQTLLRTCAGLVVLERDRNTLAMVHISAYEFFHIRETQNTRIHEDIARASLTYLCIRPLRAGPSSNIDDMNRRLRELPFLKYAAGNWGKHASHPDVEQKLNDLICRLLEDQSLLSSLFQALHYRHEIKDRGLAIAVMETLPKGQSQLHVAAYWGLQHITGQLLEAGRDVNYPDSQQWTPLHWATSNGHVAVMELLLEGGADVDAMDSQRWTPLFWASFKGNAPALRLLLDRRANHLSRDVHGWTALHWAVSRGEEQSVSVLLQHHSSYAAETEKLGLQDNLWSRTMDHFSKNLNILNGETPMELAAAAKEVNLFDILLKNQHEISEKSFNASWSSGHFDPPMSNMWRLMNKAERINGLESYMSSFWWSASRQEKNDTAWKARLLHSAIKDQKLSVMQMLIEIGANVHYGRQRSALHAAAFRKDPKFTQVLLQNGADVSLRDCHGQTALHQAVLNGFEETIAALLQGGSDVNSRRGDPNEVKPRRSNTDDAGHQTPLMLACGYDIESTDERATQTQIVDLLISYGADISLQDDNARTCLHYAAMSGNSAVIRKFIGLGADVNLQDREGISVLHHAARSCNVDLVRLVIDNGADIRSIDKYGRSAIHHLAAGDETGFDSKDLRCIFDSIYTDADPSQLNVEYDAVKARGGWLSSSLGRHTAISSAIEQSNWMLFQILRESNAALPKEFSLLLGQATREVHPTAVRFLVEHGARLRQEGDSPQGSRFVVPKQEDLLRSLSFSFEQLRLSMNVEDLDLVLKDLINIGLNINRPVDSSNRTVLHAAATHINSELVAKVLLNNGADPYADKGGWDSFLLAAIHGNLNFLRGLLTNGPKPSPEGHWAKNLSLFSDNESEDLESVCVALEKSGQLGHLGSKGHNILSAAIETGNQGFVARLLAHGADAEASDSHGWKALHRAVLCGHKAIVEILLKAGADVNAPTETWAIEHAPRPSGLYKGHKWTGHALHLAAMMGSKDITEILLDHGANVKASTSANRCRDSLHGPTALHIALSRGRSYGFPVDDLGDGRLSIARMLIERGACVDTVADHLTLHDLDKFSGYKDVWTSIRPASVPV